VLLLPKTNLKHKAFTLIELLVVIAIIAVLISLMIPALQAVKRSSNTLVCQNKIRQIAIAANLFSNDHGRRFVHPVIDLDYPSSVRYQFLWYNAIDVYLDLPANRYTQSISSRNHDTLKEDPVWFELTDTQRPVNRTIKMNHGFTTGAHDGKQTRFTHALIAKPSRTVYFADGRADDLRLGDGAASHFSLTETRVGLRHNGGANIAFVDGHVGLTLQKTKQTAANNDTVWKYGQTDFVWNFLK